MPELPPDAFTAVRIGGRLAGLSATASHGLWGGWEDDIHVAVSPHASRLRPPTVDGARRVILHWTDDGAGSDFWRVPVATALRQVALWHDIETAAACVDRALTLRLVALHDIARWADTCAPDLRRALLACRRGSGSGYESIVRQRLETDGLTVSQQVKIPSVGTVDFVVDGTRVVIEVDGYEFHRGPEKFSDDRRRDAEAIARDYVPLRFTALHVRDRWPWVRDMVLRAVARARI